MISVKQDSFARSGLEVYVTNDEKESTSKSSDSNSDDSNSSFVSDEEKFKLENGEIKEIHYYVEMFDNNFEYDYEDISSNASISLPRVDKHFYKGKKIALLKEWEEPDTHLKWKDLKKCIIGFITEQNYNENGVTLKIAGMTKLLEQEKQFSFTQTKRSEILKQMIESAGLKVKIDVTGLKDDVIDYSNVSSGSSSGLAGGQGETIDQLVANWVGNETDELKKAKLIHEGLKEYGIVYRKYNDTEYYTPENCRKHANSPGLNCGDTSILTVACMKSGGLNAYIALRCDSAHYFTVIEIKGTKYYSDLTWSEGVRSQRPFNVVWEDNTCIGSNIGSRIE